MISDFFKRLTGHPKGKPLPELDSRLALGALLVRIAKSDEHYAVEEIQKIDQILCTRYALNPVEAAKMRADCERLSAEAPDTEAFIALVQQGVPYDARVGVLDALWQVSLADRALRPEENAFLAAVATSLGIASADATGIANRHQRDDDGN